MLKTIVGLAVALAFGVAGPAHAVFHLWQINEIYKSPDGSVQFIELHTTFDGQQFTAAHAIDSDQAPNPTVTFTFPSNTASPTGNHHLLIANAAFDALNCGVQADFRLPDGFSYHPNGTVDFVAADTVAYTLLPTDGILSLGPDGSTTAANSPTNYNGDTCSLDLSVPPPVAGTFRFLTTSLPDGRPGNLWVARLLTANADGALSFSVAAGSADPLPAGLTLDPQTGLITGTPGAGSSDVTFEADDGTSVIQFVGLIDINNSGSGSGAGPTFANTSFATGRVGTPYADTLTTANGVGPFTFGVSGLPTGLRLDGQMGDISGTPTEAGTFDLNLSITDAGDSDNKGFTRIPMVILPAGSAFQFSNVVLDNGEVGTNYLDAVSTTGSLGPDLGFSASGLPDGLVLDPANGQISGTPLEAGTFLVSLGASSGGENISALLTMWVVASDTSTFLWTFFGLPIATTGVVFDGLPGVFLEAQNGTTVSYSARGLPVGISYDATTGELTGTATEVGLFPVVFTAFDSATGETLSLATQFPVLPAEGGETNGIATNFWVVKQTYNTVKGAWSGRYVYNGDRRAGAGFDPTTDSFDVTLGSRTISLAPGALVESKGKFTFKTPKGTTPKVSVVIDPRKQTIGVATRNDVLTDSLPGNLIHTLFLGDRGYKLTEFHNAPGKFSALGYRNTAFAAASGKAKTKGLGADTLSLALFLADPSFSYTAGVSTLRFRLLSGGIALIDRDFTGLGVSKESIDKATGTTLFTLGTLKDLAAADSVKLKYQSKSGKAKLAVKKADLAGLPAVEAHVELELTIGDRIYRTNVTLFEGKPGAYSTTMR